MTDFEKIRDVLIENINSGKKKQSELAKLNKKALTAYEKEVLLASITHELMLKSSARFIEAYTKCSRDHAEFLDSIGAKLNELLGTGKFNIGVLLYSKTLLTEKRKDVSGIKWFMNLCDPTEFDKGTIELIYDTDDMNELKSLLMDLDTHVVNTCTICGKSKNLSEFYFNDNRCIECRSKQKSNSKTTKINGCATSNAKYSDDKVQSVIESIVNPCEKPSISADNGYSDPNERSSSSNDAADADNCSKDQLITKISDFRGFYASVCNTMFTMQDNPEKLGAIIRKVEKINELLKMEVEA